MRILLLLFTALFLVSCGASGSPNSAAPTAPDISGAWFGQLDVSNCGPVQPVSFSLSLTQQYPDTYQGFVLGDRQSPVSVRYERASSAYKLQAKDFSYEMLLLGGAQRLSGSYEGQNRSAACTGYRPRGSVELWR